MLQSAPRQLETPMDEFRTRLLAELRTRGLSRRKASTDAQLSSSTVSMLLNDAESTPEAKTVLALADLFGWPKVDALRWARILPEERPALSLVADPMTDYQRAVERLPLADQAKQMLISMALQLMPKQLPAPAPVDASLEHTVDALLDALPYTRWSDETRQGVYQEAADLRRANPEGWQEVLAPLLHHAATVRRAGLKGPLKNRQYEYAFRRTLRRLLHGDPNIPS